MEPQKNTGKNSEKIWEGMMKDRYKKQLYLHDLVDTSNIKKSGTSVFVNPAPADYFVTVNGQTFLAEVKSCSGKTSFPFSQFTPSQNAAMLMQSNAGGEYWIFIHRLETNEWYKIPASLILHTRRNGGKSLKWSLIETRKWVL